MAAPFVKTRTPGVFKRGSRYAITYRINGRQKWETFRTMDEARRAKAARSADIDRGEFTEQSRVTLHDYAKEWVERYEGKGEHAIRSGTKDEYRRQITTYVCGYFPERLRLTEVTPVAVSKFGAWLRQQTKPAPTKKDKDRRVPLSDATVKRIMAPLRACLRTAVEEGLIRSNPAREVRLPRRVVAEAEEDEQVKAMSREELATFLAITPARSRLLFTFLAATGLRISEAVALEWRHVQLDGDAPHVKVRRAIVKGVEGPPKSKHGKRDVPLGAELVDALRAARRAAEGESSSPVDAVPVFPASNGRPLTPSNLYRRVLKPTAEEAGVPWIAFHTFRHTCATLLFAEGRNVKQVQKWLGHHSPSFTLDTYVGLLDGDVGEPLTLPRLSPEGANRVRTDPTPSGDTAGSESPVVPALA